MDATVHGTVSPYLSEWVLVFVGTSLVMENEKARALLWVALKRPGFIH